MREHERQSEKERGDERDMTGWGSMDKDDGREGTWNDTQGREHGRRRGKQGTRTGSKGPRTMTHGF